MMPAHTLTAGHVHLHVVTQEHAIAVLSSAHEHTYVYMYTNTHARAQALERNKANTLVHLFEIFWHGNFRKMTSLRVFPYPKYINLRKFTLLFHLISKL